jgi:hypothetical protein
MYTLTKVKESLDHRMDLLSPLLMPSHRTSTAPYRVDAVQFPANTTSELQLQEKRCMDRIYKEAAFPHCKACAGKRFKEPCRFQGIRTFFFTGDEMSGFAFRDRSGSGTPQMIFPSVWTGQLDKEIILLTKVSNRDSSRIPPT